MLTLRTLSRFELLDGDPPSARGVFVQPKRLALLTYLAVSQPHGLHGRDMLLGLFWPELSDADARRALRQALHYLKGVLGEAAIVSRSDGRVALADGAVRCDAVELEDALATSDFQRVVELYQGHFLAGVHVADASQEFEEWAASTRQRLRDAAARAAWTHAEQEERAGRGDNAARAARWAVELTPDDEEALRRFVALLERGGNRSAALQVYREFSDRLAREFGTAPAAETRSLVSRFTPGEMAVPSRRGEPAAALAPPGSAPRAAIPQWRRRLVSIGAAVILIAIGIAGAAIVRQRSTPLPILAVADVSAPDGRDTSSDARVLSELLATDLARIPALRVVSRGRVFEMLAQNRLPSDSPSALPNAMRRAGAMEAIEGVLYRDPARAHGLRLDLRRVDLATGLVRASYTVQADNPFELADRATAEVAASFGLRPPASSVSGVTTSSVIALRLFDEGLRAMYAGDGAAAARLFGAALSEDSSFAMAAFLAGATIPLGRMHSEKRIALLQRAEQLSARAADRDRFTIRHKWAMMTGDARLAGSYADSLATRFPDDPESHFAAGSMLLLVHNDVRGGAARFRRVIELDSMSLRATAGRCLACEGLSALIGTYAGNDSFAAAEAVARWWLARQPGSASAWVRLGSVLRILGRHDEAARAIHRAAELQPGSVEPLFDAAFDAIYREDYAEADRLLAVRLQSSSGEARQDTRWWQVISLRNQGRLGEALAIAREYERRLIPAEGYSADSVGAGQVLFEMGRYDTAAARFLTLARARGSLYDRFPSLAARYRGWFLTHAAAAIAAKGDTLRLATLADSVQRFGELSGTARDRRLHHHIRGLLLQATGRWDSAAVEFGRALGSRTYGYTRTSLELGRTLTRLGRAREAIPILRAALHGTIETNNYYVTRTELREALAQAYDSALVPDSAVAEYRLVARSWMRGDASFPARARAAAERATVLAGAASSR